MAPTHCCSEPHSYLTWMWWVAPTAGCCSEGSVSAKVTPRGGLQCNSQTTTCHTCSASSWTWCHLNLQVLFWYGSIYLVFMWSYWHASAHWVYNLLAWSNPTGQAWCLCVRLNAAIPAQSLLLVHSCAVCIYKQRPYQPQLLTQSSAFCSYPSVSPAGAHDSSGLLFLCQPSSPEGEACQELWGHLLWLWGVF